VPQDILKHQTEIVFKTTVLLILTAQAVKPFFQHLLVFAALPQPIEFWFFLNKNVFAPKDSSI
jgi:hypothetical protein